MNRRESLKLLVAAAGGSVLASSPVFALNPEHTVSPKEQPEETRVERANGIAPVFSWLTLGEVKPAGWIKEQMVRDLNEGFAGCLGKLCHEASSDIFVSNRNSLHSQNVANQEGVAWWNGETEGNWRAGFIMLAYLTGDAGAMHEADEYVRVISWRLKRKTDILAHLLPTPALSIRANFWTQACLLRGLLDYAEAHRQYRRGQGCPALRRSDDFRLWFGQDAGTLGRKSRSDDCGRDGAPVRSDWRRKVSRFFSLVLSGLE